MNNDQRKIIGYNPQTGEPVYDQVGVNQQINNINSNNNIPTNQPIGYENQQIQNDFSNHTSQDSVDNNTNSNVPNNNTNIGYSQPVQADNLNINNQSQMNVNYNHDNINYVEKESIPTIPQQTSSEALLTNNNQNLNKNSNDSENSGLKVLSIIFGIIGLGIMYFNFVISAIIFIIGIILGSIYKNKYKKKCFGLTLNIIGLLLNIVFFFVTVFILNNTMNEAKEKLKCQMDGGYWENGKCVGIIDQNSTDTEDIKKETNTNTNSNSAINNNSSNSSNGSDTYIGLWSCKDNGDSTSMEIPSLDQIDDSEYKIGLTFVNDTKYMITYSSSKWEKGTYTINLYKKDSSTFFLYYDLKLSVGEAYDSGNHQVLNSEFKDYQFSVDESYSRGFLISKDGKIRYSCYKD